ncbi:zinc-dependent alcohol dehydrogenase [Jiangella asiatica]|uniref:Galactitol-1-phosphate 5-dehydrogenase n=1 Tax=Jiangella asiatica TaxID=2530372 RepID=A0A4R5DBT6_9ACTN|nr:alcohol dehydrogenase catalytic domain-containing protein [Jiangella asiatica]TDE11162.1 galactitol-1-phosphate 5-dehydrogenase [Jiangella asiatica]
MKAMVFTRPETVEMLDVPPPEAAPGDVIVDVRAVGICGSELHGIGPQTLRRPPLIMGHELGGLVGNRRVTVNPLLSCGECDRCVAGEDNLCRDRAIVGIDRPGAFAEAVAVPERAIHEIDPAMTFETAAMVEPLANAVHALGLANPDPSDRIAVIGAGAVGLMCLLIARRRFARVDVCDLDAHRLETARRLGASSTATALQGEYDVVIDAVGAEATHRASLDVLRPGGTAVWIGLQSREPGFDGQDIVREEKRVLGSYCYTRADFAAAVKLAAELPLDWYTPFPLGEGVDIFTKLMAGTAGAVKAVLVR